MSDPVFVFGSNLAGRHGKGAALWARQHRGAIYGQGEGLQGNSYAIPTKDRGIRTLPLEQIAGWVRRFLRFAEQHPDRTFQLTPIGCGLAGYKREQIEPMFADVPGNVLMPPEWLAHDQPRPILPHPPGRHDRRPRRGSARMAKVAIWWPCPRFEDHTWQPEGYLHWHQWAEEMAKTHKQRKCPGCGRYEIWEPKS
jgi:hypothetical protein